MIHSRTLSSCCCSTLCVCARQITVDDKGLAMIFVFGLPGYRSNVQSVACIRSAGKALDLLAEAGLKGTAGVSMGVCFCGLVGNPRTRCEYAVMGGGRPPPPTLCPRPPTPSAPPTLPAPPLALPLASLELRGSSCPLP